MTSATTSTTPAEASTQMPVQAIQHMAMARVPDPADILPWLPCTLALEATVVGFTVESLLRLRTGSLVTTSCHQSSDIPLRVNGILMAWTEFEVVGERLAARITDIV
jgi:flagellar motor switch/type III secretory pathway protein FliN